MELLLNEAIVHKKPWAVETLHTMRNVTAADRRRFLSAVTEGVDFSAFYQVEKAFKIITSTPDYYDAIDRLESVFPYEEYGRYEERIVKFALNPEIDLLVIERELADHDSHRLHEDPNLIDDPYNVGDYGSFTTNEFRIRVKHNEDILNIRVFIDAHHDPEDVGPNICKLFRVVIDKNMDTPLRKDTMDVFKANVNLSIQIVKSILKLTPVSYAGREIKINITKMLRVFQTEDKELRKEIKKFTLDAWTRAIPTMKHNVVLVHDTFQKYSTHPYLEENRHHFD